VDLVRELLDAGEEAHEVVGVRSGLWSEASLPETVRRDEAQDGVTPLLPSGTLSSRWSAKPFIASKTY
jgi:hypothetical protein